MHATIEIVTAKTTYLARSEYPKKTFFVFGERATLFVVSPMASAKDMSISPLNDESHLSCIEKKE